MEGQAQPPLNVQYAAIERTQKTIAAFALLTVGALLIFSEIICMIRLSCHTSADIDMPPTISHSFLPIMALILLLMAFAYEASEYVLVKYLSCIGILIFVWCGLVVVASIVEFIVYYVLIGDGSRDDVWDSLSDLSKEYYDDNKANLEAEFRLNVGLACLFQAIVALLAIMVAVLVCVLKGKVPGGYTPRSEKQEYLSSTERPLLQQTEPRALPERPLEESKEEHPLAPVSEIEMQPYHH